MRKHEEECIFVPCYCPLLGCDFVEQMQIFVRGLEGETMAIMVKSSDKVVNLKEKILERTTIPVHLQRLIFNGTQLHDNQTLANCNIQRFSTLFLVLRLLGT
jgi:ubiquitin